MAEPPNRAHETESPLVLIVEDFEEGRQVCAEFLAFRGYRVETANDGEEALVKAHALAPDIVLMDLSLPGIDGWEATRQLKGDPQTRHIPVVALTAHALASARQRALEAGCSEVVTKPVIPRTLEEVVQRHLAARSASGTRLP